MMRGWLLAGVAACLVTTQPVEAGKAPPPPQRLVAADGPINPFYGQINPFYGQINPFYGQINPFYGQISPFWGDIQPFWGDINPFTAPDTSSFFGSNDPFWGALTPFTAKPTNTFWPTVLPYWQAAGPQWGTINAEWQALQNANATDYSLLAAQLQSFVSTASSFWGGQVQKYTKYNFMDGFGTQILSQYGINLGNPSSLANVDVVTRSQFFLAWYDGLMSFTGMDHVDWWMAAVHWSPALTQIQMPQNPVAVGLLDSTPNHAVSSVQHVQIVGGYNTYVNGHGEAVASLIAAQADGQGVMGIAPTSTVLLYNPYDSTGTASWSDVATGINTLYAHGAHIINLSLGVPGTVLSPEWANIMQGLTMNPQSVVFVKAAGNEGVAQTQDVYWNLLTAPQNLIMVGSVGPTGQISSFSNTPGEACFTLVLGICSEQNKLKYRFIVAPGELMLVSDNNGGITRESGTSFAAPLVSGAIALLDTRWPWLQQHAAETVQIILQSADDLGAPGVDPVYGWGELDVAASQSPLNFNNLVIYTPVSNYHDGQTWKTPVLGGLLGGTWTPQQLKAAILNPGQLSLWQNQKAFIVAFENIGTTYRDFAIPLSSMILNGKLKINGDNAGLFQGYIYQRMIAWAHGSGFSDFAGRTAALADGEWALSVTSTATTAQEQSSGDGPLHSEFTAVNRTSGIALSVGDGSGAHALTDGGAFSLTSDFDPSTGGVNPVLGFASGGAYARGKVAVADGLSLSVGFSHHSDDHMHLDPTYGMLQDLPLTPYEASAAVASASYTINDQFVLNASYTRLNEATGLLGGQGAGALNLSGGADTNAFTWGATATLDDGFTLAGSFTFAHTGATRFDRSALSLSSGGLDSTAYEIVASKEGLFNDRDQFRLSVAQPLHVENGSLLYRSLEVVDRNTGALGPVTEHWSLGGNREYRAEALYSIAVLNDRAEIDGFAMLDLNPESMPGHSAALAVGAQFRLAL